MVSSAVKEPPIPAVTIEPDMMIKFEKLITSARTPQQRVVCAFFVYLGATFSRAANGQTSRNVGPTKDALIAEQLMKGKKYWKT